MQMETEITVLVKTNYETLKKELKTYGFQEKEKYTVNDVYLIDGTIDILKMKSLDILKNCVLVRDIVGIEKDLLYKYKKFDTNGDIIEQGKVECPIIDVDKAIQFMKMLKYKKLFNIVDNCVVFANDTTELVVQLVNSKYIFIEMESKCEYIKKEYKNVNDLKNELCRYNLSIDSSNFFVKKAEIILNEILTTMHNPLYLSIY